jgi:DeoR/GlpR family transcriptional regulator of sugar metabolism
MSAPTAVPAATAPVPAEEIVVPNDKTLKHAARIAIENDKPIMLDYFNDTRIGKAFLGEDSVSKEKMLVRSEEEYTSLIQKIFKVADDFIVITENSIYIISGTTKKKTISAPTQ